MLTVFTAERLWDGARLLDHPIISVEDGHIASIATRATSEVPRDARLIDFPGATIAPSFFDVHIHGAAGHDVMEGTDEALTAIGTFLASRGTGSYLATTVTAPIDATLLSLSKLARLMSKTPQTARPVPSASTWKAHFSPTPNAAFIPLRFCLRRISPYSIGCLRQPRAAYG